MVCDFSLALISGAIQYHNNMSLTQYLDAAYEFLIEKVGCRPSFVLLVCAAHVLNGCKKFFTGNSRKETKDLAMKIMGRLIMGDRVEKIIKIAKLCGSVFCSQFVTDEVMQDFQSLELIINKPDVLRVVDTIDELVDSQPIDDLEAELMEDGLSKDEEEQMICNNKFSSFWKECLKCP